jgi:hypothetical protein
VNAHAHHNDHCTHWQDGDGDCCVCQEPNWCSDGGEGSARYTTPPLETGRVDPLCVWPEGVCTCGEPEGHQGREDA